MFTFSYFIIIKIYLYPSLAHFMFLILAFVLLFWFLEEKENRLRPILLSTIFVVFIDVTYNNKMKEFKTTSDGKRKL